MSKNSIRFFNDTEVRAIWGDENSKLHFSAVDTVAVLSGSNDPLNYWYVLKNRLKIAENQLLTNSKAPDEKNVWSVALTTKAL